MILHFSSCFVISGRTSFSFSGKFVLTHNNLRAWSHFKGCSAVVKMSAACRSVGTCLITTPVPGSSCSASAVKFTL